MGQVKLDVSATVAGTFPEFARKPEAEAPQHYLRRSACQCRSSSMKLELRK